jgi:S1-C subfamily serine protease
MNKWPSVLGVCWLLAGWVQAQDQDPADPESTEARTRKTVARVSKAFVFIGGGSGVIISAKGHILTNHHVAGTVPEDATVLLTDGSRYLARKLATDPVGDLALFRIEKARDRVFDHLELGDSEALEIGDIVIAAGNPFNLANYTTTGRHEPSFSRGIVSALHRRQGTYSDCIQTDAALNPGNSGGPLVTLDGKLVGLNGRIAARFTNRVNSGVGYAIPSDQIRRFLPRMMAAPADRKVYHGTINGLEISREHTNGTGALVEKVAPGTRAERQGLRAGDLITAIDGRRVFSWNRFFGILGTYPDETRIRITLERDGKSRQITLALDRVGTPAAPPSRPKGSGYLGIAVRDEDDHVIIARVAAESPAAAAGIEVGDRILEMDGTAYDTSLGFLRALWKKKPGETVMLLIEREEGKLKMEIDLAIHPADK